MFTLKTVLTIYGKLQKSILKNLISNFLIDNCSLVYKVGFCKFSTKIYIFKVPVIFENENFAARVTRARTAEVADFL